MNRTVLASVTLLLIAVSSSAEVSVTRSTDGDVRLYFEAGDDGPWAQVRPDVPSADLLNADGDLDGDSWPEMVPNCATGRPDVVWSSGGDNREIKFSWHDGDSWSAPLTLSNHAGNDELPELSCDADGNRFIVWTRAGSSRDLVLFTALAGDDAGQTSVYRLSERHDTARRAVLGVHSDGDVYVAYEEAHNGNDPVVYLAIDHVSVGRDSDGYVRASGESPIDIARSQTIVTGGDSGVALAPQVHSEDGHLWIDWIDSEGVLGWTELVDGAFTATEELVIDEAGGEQAARDQVRDEVLN